MGLNKSEKIVIRDYLHSPLLSANQGLIDTFVDAIFAGQVPEPHQYLANLHIESVFKHFQSIWDVRFYDNNLSDKQKFESMIAMELEAIEIACGELALGYSEVLRLISMEAKDFAQSTFAQFSGMRGKVFFAAVEDEYGASFTDSSWLWRSEIFESWNALGL